MTDKNILNEMWDVAINLIKGIDAIWEWLKAPVELGFNIPIIGYIGLPSFTPIGIIGAGLLAFMVFWLIKALVPFL